MLYPQPYLLVGEPDGAGAIADPPAGDPEPVTQPDVDEAPAPEAAPESTPGEPAGDGEPAPESDADFTPEERRVLLERLKDSDEFKELVPKEPEQPEASDPQNWLIARQDDPLYTAISNDRASAFKRLGDFTAKLADPQAQIMQSDADNLAAELSLIPTDSAMAERRGQLMTIAAIGMDILGVKGGKFDDANPLHNELESAIDEVVATMAQGRRDLGRLRREPNAETRAQLATSIENADAMAVGKLLRKSMDVALKLGETRGTEKAEKDFEKRTAKVVTLAKSNGHTEATAKAKRMLAGAVAQSSVNTPSKASSGTLSVEEASTLSIEELKSRGFG